MDAAGVLMHARGVTKKMTKRSLLVNLTLILTLTITLNPQGGVNAVSMRNSPELEAKAPDILRHQLVGGKVHTCPLSGTAFRHRSPTCYLQVGPPGNYSSSLKL